MTKKSSQENSDIELTQEAYDELVAELNHRKTVERENIAEEISAARELGDLRENHAYTVSMEKKEMNENRITYLEDMLKKVKIVKASTNSNIVTIGRSVVIKNLTTGTTRVITLVGNEETQAAMPGEGKISVDSPIGLAVNKAKIGDTVEISTPVGVTKYKIEKFA